MNQNQEKQKWKFIYCVINNLVYTKCVHVYTKCTLYFGFEYVNLSYLK